MAKSAAVAALAGWILSCAVANAESLYREETFKPLVSDNKARRVGDVLTVLILENATAASSVDTAAQRKNGLGFEFTDVLRRSRSISVHTNNDFDGGGATQRSGRLLAQITVTVVGIEPGGDLRISGDQLLEINREQQKIRLEGRVRLQDIAESNTIASTRVADARISYVGHGDVASRTNPPWWSSFLTWIGL